MSLEVLHPLFEIFTQPIEIFTQPSFKGPQEVSPNHYNMINATDSIASGTRENTSHAGALPHHLDVLMMSHDENIRRHFFNEVATCKVRQLLWQGPTPGCPSWESRPTT